MRCLASNYSVSFSANVYDLVSKFVGTINRHYLSKQFSDTICWHYMSTLLADTICRHYLPTLSVETNCRHYLSIFLISFSTLSFPNVFDLISWHVGAFRLSFWRFHQKNVCELDNSSLHHHLSTFLFSTSNRCRKDSKHIK